MRHSLTYEMADLWRDICTGSTGALLPVNHLEPGCFGFSTPSGEPPVVLLNGEVVLDVYITYDIEVAKHGKYLD